MPGRLSTMGASPTSLPPTSPISPAPCLAIAPLPTTSPPSPAPYLPIGPPPMFSSTSPGPCLAIGPAPTISLTSLPDTVLRCIFQALSLVSSNPPEATHSKTTFSLQTRPRTHSPPGTSSSAGAMLAATCTRLSAFYRLEFVTYLDFSSTSWSCVDTMQPHDLSRLLSRFPRVRSIDLALNAALGRRILSALLVSGSLSRAASLTELHLDNSTALLDDDSVKDIVMACPRLKILDLSACESIGDGALKAISDGLADSLEELYVDAPSDGVPACDLSDEGCARLRNLRNLKCLSLDYREGLTDATFMSLAGLHKMHTLSVCNTAVSLPALRQCLPEMRQLVSLRLACCPAMAADSLVSILPGSIEHLDVRGTIALDTASAAALGERLPRLVALETGCTPDFADLSIFGKRCLERLEVLRLCGARRLPDEDAASCVRKMRRLRALTLLQSPLLSEKTMAEASMLPRLERLDADRQCVTPGGASILAKAIQTRQILRFVNLCIERDREDVAGDIGTDLTALSEALKNVGGSLDVVVV